MPQQNAFSPKPYRLLVADESRESVVEKKEAEDNRRIAIISGKVKDSITLPDTVPEEIYTEEDILGRMLDLVRENDGKQLRMLLFLAAEEVGIVANFLSGFNREVMACGFVVISPGGFETKLSSARDSILALRTTRVTEQEFSFLLSQSFSLLDERIAIKKQQHRRRSSYLDIQRDLEEMIKIGKALSLEKDSDKLLRSILYLSKKITGADAGSIFLVEEDSSDEKWLRFKYSHTFSMDLAYEGFSMPLDEKSITGYVAITGRSLNIEDVYALEGNTPYSFNQSYDRNHGYRTKSMLTVPMRNHVDDVIGVIQLINSKESHDREKNLSGNEAFEIHLKTAEDYNTKVVPFAARYESLMEAVASQAAIALENNRMIIQIEHEFDEFVKASVSAIDSRDPATSGHSERVARISVSLAEAVNVQTEGSFKDLTFSSCELKELELAGLLHDFGKVYIDPNIFLKGEKLFPKDRANMIMRLNYLYRTIELSYANQEREAYAKSIANIEKVVPAMEKEKSQKLANLLQVIELIDILNKPNVDRVDNDLLLKNADDLADDLEYSDRNGEIIPLITDFERSNLTISRGSLNAKERMIIESHVEHSYNFVSKIPWPPEYRLIPDIVAQHHEKLDGSGYPNGLKGRDNIFIQARIMGIADIFDALNAPDRPYKKALPLAKVLAILKEEAEIGKLDPDLIEIFISKRLYEKREAFR